MTRCAYEPCTRYVPDSKNSHARYCSESCRLKAKRRRQKGVADGASPDSGGAP